MEKTIIPDGFDPDGTGQDNGNYFGLPFTAEQSRLVLVSVPWDVTASYGGGACYGPDAIIGASTQLDLYDQVNPGAWRRGIGTAPIDYSIQEISTLLREEAKKVMKHLESGGSPGDDQIARRVERVNDGSDKLNEKVCEQTGQWLARGKLVGLVGGDHSTPYGFVKALSEKEKLISVLHIDAHADLRPGYEGFNHSHASIMYNISHLEAVEKLIQVGVRDMCDCEAAEAADNPKIEMFTGYDLARSAFRGTTWDSQCEQIVGRLGEKVYVSFDIDGLTPENAPHTGTPVPGGLTFDQAVYLIEKVADSGRRIVGFDLCEVAPEVGREWDANVGARVLYKLCNLMLKTDKPEDKGR